MLQTNKAAAQQAANAAEAADKASIEAAPSTQAGRPQDAVQQTHPSEEAAASPAQRNQAAAQPPSAEQANEQAAADGSAKSAPGKEAATTATASQPIFGMTGKSPLTSTPSEQRPAAAQPPAAKPMWQPSQANSIPPLLHLFPYICLVCSELFLYCVLSQWQPVASSLCICVMLLLRSDLLLSYISNTFCSCRSERGSCHAFNMEGSLNFVIGCCRRHGQQGMHQMHCSCRPLMHPCLMTHLGLQILHKLQMVQPRMLPLVCIA